MSTGGTGSAFERAMAEHDPMEGFEFEMEARVPRAAKLREDETRRRREEEQARRAEEDAASRERERQEQAAGQHGGDGSSGDETGGAPEPAPQTDEADDGEHTESTVSTQEEAEPEQERAAEPKRAPQRPQEAQERPQSPSGVPEAQEAVQELQKGAERPQEPAPHRTRAEAIALTGTAEAFDKSVKFDHGGKGVQLARFPEGIIQALRARLAALTGGAEPPHNSPLVVGFLLAQLGLDPSDYDENTRLVARLFARAESPRLDAIEEAVSGLGSLLSRLGADQRSHTKAVRALSESVEGLELAQSYMLSDRLEQSGQGDTTGGGADLANPQASATLENMRRTARQRAAQRTVAEGRPIR